MGRLPLTEPTLTMLPELCLIMPGSTAREQRNTPVTLVASVSCHCSSDDSHSMEVGPELPLLLTSTSILPNRSSTAATISATACSFLMSQTVPITDTPEGSRATAADSAMSAYRLQIATWAPAARSDFAMSKPNPRPPPVTSATRPEGRSGLDSTLIIHILGSGRTSTTLVMGDRDSTGEF